MRKLVFTLFVILLASTILPGQRTVSFNFESTSLRDIINELEETQELVFSYTEDLITDVVITAKGKNLELNEALDVIFRSPNIDYKVIDNSYVVLTAKELDFLQICAQILDPDGEALPYTTLYIPSIANGTNADENGMINWNIKVNPEATVELSFIGYQKLITQVSELLGCDPVYLKTEQFSITEIIVKDYVTTGIEQSVSLDHMILRPDKISVMPGLTDADVLQMVQLLPGVESLDESATGLYVRGGTQDQNLILYDGIPIYNSGHFFGMISGFNPNIIDKVNVYMSGFGPRFGGRLSSVIDIKSDNTMYTRPVVNAGVNFTHADISLNIPLIDNKMQLILGARKSYTDIVETPTYRKLSQRVFRQGKFEEVMEEEDPESVDFSLNFDFNDYNLRWIYNPNEKHHIDLNYFRVDDNLDFNYLSFDEDFSTNDKLDLSNTGVGFNWSASWHSNFESNLSVSYTKLLNNYAFNLIGESTGESNLQNKQVNNIVDKTIKLDNKLTLSENINFDLGIQYADIEVEREWVYDADEEEDLVIDKNNIWSSFFSFNSSPSKIINTQLGLRWNYAEATSENFIEPRALLQIVPSNKFQLKASAGLYRQFMNQVIEFNDLGLNQNFWVLYGEDESTSVSRSLSYSLGLLYHPKTFQFEIEAYYKDLDNLTSSLSVLEGEDDVDFDLGSGNAKGVNLMMMKRFSTFQSWISYSFSAVDYTFNNDADEELRFKAPHDRPHSFSITGLYEKNNIMISACWKIASGIRFTPAYDLFVDEDNDAYPLFDAEDINTDQLPAFHRLDLSVMYDFNLNEKGLKGKVGFSFLNLYNRRNILSREYFSFFEDEEDEFVLEARDREMLRFTPNLVFRISY